MIRIIFLVGFLFVTVSGYSQNLDSLVLKTDPQLLTGKIPTYYSAGKHRVAARLQHLATSVADYYEKLYGMPFHVKMAVLDSAHWPATMAPYGIIFSQKGWVFMHAGMRFDSFQKVYGMEGFASITADAIGHQKMKGDQLVEAFLEFYTVHELGHYFLNALSGARYPDFFTNEWMASYFAYQYFVVNKPAILPAFELFCQLFRDHIHPDHRSVESFNLNYGNDGIPTYGWYHVNFYFLCKDVWNCAGLQLIPQYRTAFPKAAARKFSPDEIVGKLALCSQALVQFETNLNQNAGQ